MTKKLDPDRPNKARRGRPKKKKNPNASNAMKAFWAVPENRERMKERDRARVANMAINPEYYTRHMVPNGMTKATVAPLIAKAKLQADRYIKKMQDEGIISEVLVPDSDEAKGVAALHEACVLALSPGEKQAKLAAIRTVLEYTKSKPESKSKININTSEQWLAEIAASDAGAE